MKKIIFSILIVCGFAGMLSAQTVKIAQLDFKKAGISDAEYSDFSEYLRKDLSSRKNAVVMNRDMMIKYLTAEKFNAAGCVDTDCAAESASILKADIILYGMIVKNEKKFSVTIGSYNVKFRDKSFTEKFESESAADIKKKLNLISDKISASFPKTDIKTDIKTEIKTDEKTTWDNEFNEKDERKYNLKYNIGINTGYLIMLGAFEKPVTYHPNPFLLGLKFQIEFLKLIKVGVIGEFAFSLTPPESYNPYIGSGGAILSFTTPVYKQYLHFIVDLALIGGVYSYSPNTSLNIGFFNISPRLALQYFPVSIFGIELSVGYNYYISVSTQYKIPDAVSVGLNFIFRL